MEQKVSTQSHGGRGQPVAEPTEARVPPPEADAQVEAPDPVFEWMNANPGIAGTLVILVLALLKLAAVTGYDPTTMVALANEVGPTSVITSTVFSPPWPLIMVLATLSFRWFLISKANNQRWLPQLAIASFFGILLIVLLPLDVIWLPFLLALLILAGPVSRRIRGKGYTDEVMRTLAWVNRATLVALAFIMLWTAFANRLMWLPKEVLYVRDGSAGNGQMLEGYVLRNDGVWTSFLQSGVRRTLRVKTGAIQTRTVCRHHQVHTVWWAELSWASYWIAGRQGDPPEHCKTVKKRTIEEHPGVSLPAGG